MIPLVLAFLLPSVTSLTLCALVRNDTTKSYEIDFFDNKTGVLQTWVTTPELDSYGLGPSAGAQYGTYYTISQSIERESSYFVAQLQRNTSNWVKMTMPPPFANLTRYGIASLNIDSVTRRALGFIIGIDDDGCEYGFLGFLNDKTGTVDKVLADLSDEMRTWTYMYDGITAWDPSNGMYYLSAVIGEHHETTLLAYNLSAPGPQTPVFSVPFPDDEEGLGMYTSFAISQKLASKHPGSPGLVALVDDIANTAAAIWLLGPPKEEHMQKKSLPLRKGPLRHIRPGERARKPNSQVSTKPLKEAPTPWIEVIQWEPETLFYCGNNNMVVDAQDRAFAVFYDHHKPVSNQVVIQTDLITGKEVGRTIVRASRPGTQIAYIALCPA